MEDEKNNIQTKDIELNQKLMPKEDSKPQIHTQKTKRINNSREKDLSNEILYFSINQDSK